MKSHRTILWPVRIDVGKGTDTTHPMPIVGFVGCEAGMVAISLRSTRMIRQDKYK